MIVSVVAIFITLIFNSLVWAFDMQAESDRSFRLLDLMPVDENEKEMVLLQSMRTSYVKMDKERERIMETGQELIDVIKRNGHIQELILHFNQLMIQTYRTFQTEEKEMEERQYDEEKTKAHKHSHILLRQRLTTLFDHLRQSSGKLNSVRNTVRRTLSRLYDLHFCEDDVIFVEEMIPSDEKLGKTIGQDGLEMEVVAEGVDVNNNNN
ncbi:MAG: hypothetical protein EZS28_034225 [Streblomastix strix]|uniref:Uncharacterized protein n=1 Tax=Streblomastix strix TaxID=222440 RepID=A0A5J4UI54_9EUKA|nr:MAG: hypothetical protein EZS28_034225 [Streblomastix strix]